MSTPETWMGIDLGTQGVKVLVVGADGTVHATGTATLESHRDGVRHEQDPDDWWRAVSLAVRAAGAGSDVLDSVRGVAVDATSGTVALLDDQGRSTGPALMYDDARASAEVEVVNDVGRETWRRAGYQRMQRSWGLPKLLWLLAHEAGGGGQLAHQSDVVNRRLVGHRVPTDTSNALKTGVDAAHATWPQVLIDELGVPARVLPGVVLPGTVLGEVCALAAAETGLRAGTPVVAGMTDGCAAQIGAGVTETGSWNSVLGTTLVLKGVASEPLADPGGVVYSHRSPDGRWLPGGASSVGAGLVSRELPGADLDELARSAEGLLPTDLLRYPLVSPGERFPFVAPDAVDVATRAASGPAETFAALMQGTAYAERLCLDYLRSLGAPTHGRLVLSGGASRNEVWSQLRADVLGRPVDLLTTAEPAMGMAVLARAAVGAGGRTLGGSSSLVDAAREMVHVERTLEPRAAITAAHEEGYLSLVQLLADRGWLPAAVAHDVTGRTPA